MKERICYICEGALEYKDYIKCNSESLKELDKKWESDVVEFYCCSCKRFITQLQEGPNDLYALLDWARNGRLMRLKELNLINESELRELKRLRNE